MQFTLTVLNLFGILALAQEQQVPALAKILEDLHECPPPRKLGYSTAANVQTKRMTQKLDHFNENNKITWQMRYMKNDVYFKYGGPMFILLGGEWAIQPAKIQHGIFHDLAREHNGIMFKIEHRFYGESRPTPNLSVKYLQYLKVNQSLADLAHFIRTQRATDPRLTNSKVIISGCSYSATVAVWFSKLYPELVDGTWASSAPLLAQVDFKEYHEVVGNVLKDLGSQQCYNRLKNGIAQLEAMFADHRAAKAKYLLNLCSNFDHQNVLDLWSLFSSISHIFANIVQSQTESDVPNLCSKLMSFTDDITAVTVLTLEKLSINHNCIDATYNSTMSHYSSLSYTIGNYRRWFYQTCNEFGWFQTSTSENQPFGSTFPVTLYTTLCSDLFGAKYTTEHINHLVAETNKVFGGRYPNVKNVYMTYGGLDPWSALGQGLYQGASVIPLASHCSDLGSPSYNDNAEMRASKDRLAASVRKWLWN